MATDLKRMGYRPGPKRRSYIPKPGSAKGRPLGISNLEDKIVEAVTKRTLEPIYEAVFEDSSHAYRPGSGPHKCVDALGRTIQQGNVNYIVEADIKSFYDAVNHGLLMNRLARRVKGPRVLRLISRYLHAGVILPDGKREATACGVPQGGPLTVIGQHHAR